jgi:hypothetical protein
MPEVHAGRPPQPARTRGGEQFVAWLLELEECRIGGLVEDEDYAYQRAEKLAVLLRPTRCLWIASVIGGSLVGAVAGATTWHFTRDWRATAGVATVAGMWGLTSLGRLIREKFIELQLRERRKILVALLENDLLTASEFADYDDRLAQGNPDII